MDLTGINLNDYPALAVPHHYPWAPMYVQFKLLSAEVDDAMIANVCVVSFVGAQVVLTHMDTNHWNHAGGTRKPGEAIIETARRELMAAAGAELLSFHPFGLFESRSLADKPYRPHIPHPVRFGLIGYGDVAVTGRPTNPPDGETVMEIRQVELAEAKRFSIEENSGFDEMWSQVLALAVRGRSEEFKC